MSPPSTKHINNNQEYIKQKHNNHNTQYTSIILGLIVPAPPFTIPWCWMMSTQSQHPYNIQPWPILDTKPTSLLVSASIPFTEPLIFRKWFAPSTVIHTVMVPFDFFQMTVVLDLSKACLSLSTEPPAVKNGVPTVPHDRSLFRIKNEPFFLEFMNFDEIWPIAIFVWTTTNIQNSSIT